MSERNANYWIMQCGEHLLQIHAKERTTKELESQNYTSMIILSDFFFSDLWTENHQLPMKTDRLYCNV